MTAGPGGHALLLILADDYGDPSRGPSFEYETFVPAFRRFFSTVTVFPQDRELRERGYFGASGALLELVESTRPDIVFCVPFENQLDWNVLRSITERGVQTLAWMCDDHWRWEDFSRYIAHCFGRVVTTDRDAYVAYHAIPGAKPILSQWGVDVARLRQPDSARDIPVSFIGACRPHRARMVDAIRTAGIPVLTRGTGWPEGRATRDEMVEILARSLISLNFSDSSQRHRRGSTQLKARPFELAASGSCVVTEPDPQMSAFYEPGTEVVVASGRHRLVRSLQWLLQNDGERMAVAEAAWRRTAREHTYDVRLRKILSIVGLDRNPRATEGTLCVTR